MYWADRGGRYRDKDYIPPTEVLRDMEFPIWLKEAKNADENRISNSSLHYYFMANAPAGDRTGIITTTTITTTTSINTTTTTTTTTTSTTIITTTNTTTTTTAINTSNATTTTTTTTTSTTIIIVVIITTIKVLLLLEISGSFQRLSITFSSLKLLLIKASSAVSV